jgi:hypothetical protein
MLLVSIAAIILVGFVAPVSADMWPNTSTELDTSYSYDMYNGTYLQFWLFNLTHYGDLRLYGLGYGLMIPMLAILGYWIFFIIWTTYLASVWMRTGDVVLPIVIGLISAGIWAVLIPAEAYLYLGVMFAICIGVILLKTQ